MQEISVLVFVFAIVRVCFHILSVKFFSPQINSGLYKMYRAEVLMKFPVIQHFLFGSLLSMSPHGFQGASAGTVERLLCFEITFHSLSGSLNDDTVLNN